MRVRPSLSMSLGINYGSFESVEISEIFEKEAVGFK
jgi:hypothetical protein